MSDDPACYGVCCPLHGRCARYTAVDGAVGTIKIIGTCATDTNSYARPLFVQATGEHDEHGLA